MTDNKYAYIYQYYANKNIFRQIYTSFVITFYQNSHFTAMNQTYTQTIFQFATMLRLFSIYLSLILQFISKHKLIKKKSTTKFPKRCDIFAGNETPGRK